MEPTIGRLNHAAHIIPQGRNFINRLRDLQSEAQKYGPQIPNQSQRDDLKLWLNIIKQVSEKGIDIKNITFTSPAVTTYSDACETGMGGYNTEGLAWRFALPPDMIGLHSINLLEFIASCITIQLTITRATSPQKLLDFTDSSSALGWLHSTSFKSSYPAHDKVARWIAKKLISNDAALYSQHIRGKYNFISDSLSRDTHIPIQQLTHTFRFLLPEQTSQNFTISTLPPEIIS